MDAAKTTSDKPVIKYPTECASINSRLETHLLEIPPVVNISMCAAEDNSKFFHSIKLKKKVNNYDAQKNNISSVNLNQNSIDNLF